MGVGSVGLDQLFLIFFLQTIVCFSSELSESECNVMKKLLLQYEEASGQGVNFIKSGIMFNSNIT